MGDRGDPQVVGPDAPADVAQPDTERTPGPRGSLVDRQCVESTDDLQGVETPSTDGRVGGGVDTCRQLADSDDADLRAVGQR